MIQRAPGGGVIDQLSRLISQWRRLLDSPLGLSASNAADAIDVMAKRASRHLTDEAAEGIAYTVAKTGGKDLAEEMLQQYSDDVAEGVFGIVRRQSDKFDDLASVSGNALDDATDGLAKLINSSTDDISTSQNAFEKIMSGGLPPNKQDDLFKEIKNWDNASGELADAADGARRWLDESALGPQKLSEAMDELSAEASEEYMALIGKHFGNNPGGADIARINDSLTAVKASMDTTAGAGSYVATHLGNDPDLIKKFEALRCLDPADMTQTQRDWLKAIRNSIPSPGAGTSMQRVISLEDFQRYATGEFDTITGSVAVRSHVSDLGRSADEVIGGLRLDYAGTNFAPNKGYVSLEFDLPNAGDVSVPYSPSMGGTITDAYPRTGNGFISNVDGTIRPEFTLPAPPKGIAIPDNTVLKKYAPDGSVLGSSTWSAATQSWTPPLTGL